MMKKNGFTLAEVLITLAIIGVVATMTLPALMTNVAEQQAKTALKKGINTLTEAAHMNQALEGFDYSGLIETDKEAEATSLYGLLANRTSMDFAKSGLGKLESHQGGDDVAAGNYTVFLRDGTAIMFKDDADSESEDADEVQDDKVVYGIKVIYDTNGSKGPNIVSNCQGEIKGAENDVGDSDVDTACPATKRVIKDQFGLRLRGSYAIPNGAAARWAYEKQ